MFCANCGTKQNEGEKFCPNCGTKFEEPLKVEMTKVEEVSKSETSMPENIVPGTKEVRSKKDNASKIVNKTKDIEKCISDTESYKEVEEIKQNDSKIKIAQYRNKAIPVETTQESNLYKSMVWERINSKSMVEHFLRGVYLSSYSGIISDIVYKEDVEVSILEYTYLKNDVAKGRIEYFLVLKDNKKILGEIEQKIIAYNKKARENNYYSIKYNKMERSVKARYVRKEASFLDSLFGWNAEFYFKEILELCKSIRRTK